MEKKDINQKTKVVDKPDQPELKKRSFKVKAIAWIITAFIFTAIGSPFIALGVLIGWWIWG